MTGMTSANGSRYSQHQFSQVPQAHHSRSLFDRSFAAKDTMDFDYLTPVFCDEVLPGDTINLNVKSFCRLAPQVVPLMDAAYMDYYFFFVPNRLVWSNWEKFNGAQDNPGDSTDFFVPILAATTGPNHFTVGSIFDHFGLPTGVSLSSTNFTGVNALPFRAYNLIWNTWFRDQNLQNSVGVATGDGPDALSNYTLLKGAKKHDYFTSALPWPQKGTAVNLGITGQVPVVLNPTLGVGTQWRNISTGAALVSQTGMQTNGGGTIQTTPAGTSVAYDPNGTLYADATNFGSFSGLGTTINNLRLAMMTQSLLELDARGGTRYVEILKSHFGVISPDFRLQRPEFLSGGSVQIQQHVVPQSSATGATGTTTPQGNLASYSTAASGSSRIGFSKSFVEHGYVIGLVKARGDITYQQGINKMWTRRTRYEFFWPKLQELGEQAIRNCEIYISGSSVDNNTFGYQERYAEYRYRPSEIKGQFRSTYATSLDVWHLAEKFATLPALNSTFIQSNTPITRNLVLTGGAPQLLCDYYFDYKHARPIMSYGVPATFGRF